MNEPQTETDEQLAIKKRARRRLIGAIVFVSFAAVVLPMVMDEEPPVATPSIELKIPAQEKGFAPPSTGVAKPSVGVAEPIPPSEGKPPVEPVAVKPDPATLAKAEVKAEAKTEVKPEAKVEAKPEAKAAAKSDAKPATVKPEAKPAAASAKAETKPAAKAPEVKSAKADTAKPPAEAKRAQSILDGKAAESAGGGDGPHVVLIGAFSNAGNVQTLQKKIGGMGLRVYAEPLDTPQGKKTRVRVGPFPNRDAAEKAVARLKTIGVGGVVAPKS